MNICMLADTFHPKIGGAETYARTIANGLAARAHNVVVITDGVGLDSPGHEVSEGVDIFRISSYAAAFDDRDKVRWDQMYFGLLGEICEILKDRRTDIIHANSLSCTIVGAMVALSTGCPLVYSLHEQEPENEPFGEGRCRMVFSRLPVDGFLAGSEFYRNKAIRFDADPSRVHLIYHGIDIEKFSPRESTEFRRSIGVTRDEYFVVCAARLKERKGLLDLVRAARTVKDHLPGFRLLIAGSCNAASRAYANQLYREIEELNLTGTVWIDETLMFDAMPGIYASADLVVQPSLAEGLGLALLEGMASGKPVIGTDITGIREILVHEENGLLVPPQDPHSLATAILRLAGDSNLSERLAATGLRQVRSRFSIERTLSETETLYQRLVNGAAVQGSLSTQGV